MLNKHISDIWKDEKINEIKMKRGVPLDQCLRPAKWSVVTEDQCVYRNLISPFKWIIKQTKLYLFESVRTQKGFYNG